MRKFSLMLVALIIGLTHLQAQIVIEESDFAVLNQPYNMSIFNVNPLEPVSISDYSTAPWDFTFLTENVSDVITFISPSESSLASVFPNANMIMNYQNLGLGFIDKNASQVSLEGLAFNSDVIPEILQNFLGEGLVLNFDNLEGDDIVLMEFPMEMGSELSNSKSISDEGYAADILSEYGIDPAIIPEEYQALLDVTYLILTIEFSVESEVDGYGILNIPNKELETLRQKNTTGIGFSIATPTPFGNYTFLDTAITTTSYAWYAKEEGVPVLTAQVDNEGAISQFLYKVFEDTKVEDVMTNHEVKLFPNPAQDYFVITTTSEQASRICLFDVLGRKVLDQTIAADSDKINVSELPKGVYVSKVFGTDGHILNTSKLSIHK